MVGKVVLGHKMPGMVVGIHVLRAVPQIFHRSGRGVAQMQRHRCLGCGFRSRHRRIHGQIRRVAFGRRGQVNNALTQGNAGLGHAQFLDGIKRGVGQNQGIGVGVSNVFRSGNNQASGYKCGRFAAHQHPSGPIQGGIGIRPADAFDEGRSHVVVGFASLVVLNHQPRTDGLHKRIVHFGYPPCLGLFQDPFGLVEHFPTVAPGQRQEHVPLPNGNRKGF